MINRFVCEYLILYVPSGVCKVMIGGKEREPPVCTVLAEMVRTIPVYWR